MIDRSKRPGRIPCPPWTPPSGLHALTFENLSRIEEIQRSIRAKEAIVADSLTDPHTADAALELLTFAWQHSSAIERSHLLTVALTPEVRAAAASERGWA